MELLRLRRWGVPVILYLMRLVRRSTLDAVTNKVKPVRTFRCPLDLPVVHRKLKLPQELLFARVLTSSLLPMKTVRKVSYFHVTKRKIACGSGQLGAVLLAAAVSLGVSYLAQARLEAVELAGGYIPPYFRNGFLTNPLEDCFRRLVSEANRHSIQTHQVNSNPEQEKPIQSWLLLTLTHYLRFRISRTRVQLWVPHATTCEASSFRVSSETEDIWE